MRTFGPSKTFFPMMMLFAAEIVTLLPIFVPSPISIMNLDFGLLYAMLSQQSF
jgi:hypothetical protein